MEEIIRIATLILAKYRIKYVIIGGIAVLAWGEPRTTFDVDIVITLVPADLEETVIDFINQGFTVSKDAIKRLTKNLAVKFKYGVYSVDLRLASFTIDKLAIERAKQLSVAGNRISIASKEDVIIFKLAHFDYKDRADIEAILRRQRSIDFEYIAKSAQQLAKESGRAEILENLTQIMTWDKQA